MTAAAALSGILIPWELAFVPAPELYSAHSPYAALNLLLVSLFGLDMMVNLRLAFFEGEALVDSGPAMAGHYLKGAFPADLLGFIPADWLLLGLATLAAAGHGGNPGVAAGALEWVPMLRLLHLARLYRVR